MTGPLFDDADDPLVPFGKYRGRPLSELMADRSYCEWMLGIEWLERDHPLIHARIRAAFPPPAPETRPMDDLDLRCQCLAAAARSVVPGTDSFVIGRRAAEYEGWLRHGWPEEPPPVGTAEIVYADQVPPMTVIQDIVREIQKNLIDRSINLHDVLDAQGIDPGGFHRWERGVCRPRLGNWRRLERILELSRAGAGPVDPPARPGTAAGLNGATH